MFARVALKTPLTPPAMILFISQTPTQEAVLATAVVQAAEYGKTVLTAAIWEQL